MEGAWFRRDAGKPDAHCERRKEEREARKEGR
jgi:hypothetical protein